ncbi:portal protein, partial [Candidatus Roizmanbacteria bacterium CG_4_10_14_0_2_um_filter_36_35]
MPDTVLAFNLLAILILALIGGLIAKKIRQPLILGYVLSGILLGGLIIRTAQGQQAIGSLAEIGVALLMFSIGVEFSFSRLSKVRNIAFWGALIQILLTILFGVVVFPKFGFDFYTSLFLGSCFSLSSTAIVTKILAEKGELDTLPGEIMIGWLLVQDLAVLPMVLILPQIFALGSLGLSNILLTIGKIIFLLGLCLVLGRALIPRLMDKVAAVNSREILILTVVTLCLLSAFGTSVLGLSFALGAFLAGILISESAQNHAVFSEIRPLRDVFSIVFFVSLGLMLTPSFFLANLRLILGLALMIISVKFVICLIVSLFLGYHFKVSFLVAAGLVQIGEFSFVLGRLGLGQNLISTETYSLIISVALVTITLTPFIFNWAPKIYRYLIKSRFRPYLLKNDCGSLGDQLQLENHIVICGYGRVGGWLGRALMLCQIPFVVVDYNHEVVKDLRNKGVPVVY